jgi:hypothetical protein
MSNLDEIAKYLENHKCELCGSTVEKETIKHQYDDVKDDDNNVKAVKIGKPSREELLNMLDEMVNSFDNLPRHVQFGFVTQVDSNAALLLIAQILKS